MTSSPRVFEALPRICLIYPNGDREWFNDCEIEDSLIPDLSFTGTSVNREKRERIVTNCTYTIVKPPADKDRLSRTLDAIAGVKREP